MMHTLRILWPAVVTTITLSTALGQGVRQILDARAAALASAVRMFSGLDWANGTDIATKKGAAMYLNHQPGSTMNLKTAPLGGHRQGQADLEDNLELGHGVLKLREDMATRAEVMEGSLRHMDEAMQRANQKSEELARMLLESGKKSEEIIKTLEEQQRWKQGAEERMARLEAALKTREKSEQAAAQTAKRMVKMYSNMTPEKAAGILKELPDSAAASILSAMKETEASRILVLFPTKRAAALATRLNAARAGAP